MVYGRNRPVAWVTGATGFLGRHVSLALMRRGYDVVGFARSSHAGSEMMTQWGLSFIEFGSIDRALLNRAESRAGPPVVVFHAIGSGSVGQASADPAADIDRTLRTTECLLDLLNQRIPGARFIYPSSAAVYGITAARAINEDEPTKPISLYGENKLGAEAICRDFARRSGRQIVVLQFFRSTAHHSVNCCFGILADGFSPANEQSPLVAPVRKRVILSMSPTPLRSLPPWPIWRMCLLSSMSARVARHRLRRLWLLLQAHSALIPTSVSTGTQDPAILRINKLMFHGSRA